MPSVTEPKLTIRSVDLNRARSTRWRGGQLAGSSAGAAGPVRARRRRRAGAGCVHLERRAGAGCAQDLAATQLAGVYRFDAGVVAWLLG